MFRFVLPVVLFCLIMQTKGSSQSITPSVSSAVRYHPPSADKPSWQWLNLMTSATYYRVVKEGEVDFNSSLLYASRSLGLSRLPILAEGINDPELVSQSQWVDQLDPATGIRQLAGLQGKKRLHGLLLLGAYYAFQPLPIFSKDSAVYFLKEAIAESKALKEKKLKRQALCLLGKTYLEANEVNRSDSVFNYLIQDCKKTGDQESEARAYSYWALYPPPNPATFPVQMERFQKAAELYHKLNNSEAEINALTDAGYLLAVTFQLQKAHDVFLNALKLAEAIKYPYTHYLTDALAMVTEHGGKFGEPLKYTLQTIRTSEATRDSIGWGYFYNRLGNMYRMEGGRERESLKWFKKGLDRFIQAGDAGLSVNLYGITSLIGEMWGERISQAQAQEVLDLVSSTAKQVPPRLPRDQIHYNLAFSRSYMLLKQYPLAERYVQEAQRLEKQFPVLRSAHTQSLFNLLLGEICFYAGQWERSQKYLEAYLSNPHRLSLLQNDIVAYSHLVTIDSSLGNAASGFHRYYLYTRLLDSNFRVSKIRQAEELQVLYETEEKEAQIALLNQKAKLEEANLKQATLVRNVTIAGIVVALLIAALLFRQSKQRKRTNKVITQKNDQLERLLTEKEWLVKEIHHRVKNNLQIVMSLLNSQSAYIDNPYALTAIHDSQHRVYAMSLIHQKLYGSENVTAIDMSVYIRELVSYLADSFDTGQRIRFEYRIDPLELDVGQAVPIGLILNEAITNAIKYAFPDGRSGVIAISLTRTEGHHCTLIIADNGIGLPARAENKKPGSLGMSMMEGLSEDLEGSFSIESNRGTTIKLSFAQERSVRRTAAIAPMLITNN